MLTKEFLGELLLINYIVDDLNLKLMLHFFVKSGIIRVWREEGRTRDVENISGLADGWRAY